MLMVIVLGIILTWYMAGRALKPVQDLKTVVEEINGQNLSTRVAGFQAKDEISQLANSFNEMLDKIEHTVKRQKEFSINVAHELKTPLAAIQTNLEILQMEEEPLLEEYQETMAVVGRNTQRLSDLVDDLLRLNDEQAIRLNEVIDCQQLFTQLEQELAYLFQEKQIIFNVSHNGLCFYGNYNLIYSGLFNLIENGIKYNEEFGRVEVIVEQHDNDMVIQVADNGIGIPKEALRHIFEPFYRVERSRSRKIGGSGLGLAMVKSIVEKHQGTISVYSQEGQGTTFTIIFPQQLSEQQG